jgi:hypothetical protein
MILCVAFLLFPQIPSRAGDRTTVPNDVTIELLGKCIIYSFSYQRMLNEHFGLEGSLSLLGGSDDNVLFYGAGGRAYLTASNAAPCLGFGIVGLTASTDSGPFDDSDSNYYFYIGPGFEYRSEGGFILRGTMYFLLKEGFAVWPGAQLGIAF